MRKQLKLFVIYFPVILVTCQVLVNILFFIDKGIYFYYGFYLNQLFGTNAMFAAFLVAFTFMFRFCAISRFSAIAEIIFAVYYMVVQKDDVYNILMQITIGTIAILLTCHYYIRKFPFCKLSLLVSFFNSFFKTGSCNKALKDWDEKIAYKLKKQKLKTIR